MQYMLYRNRSNINYPYLVDVQSDIIGNLNTRLVIPLFPLKLFQARPAERLNPVIHIEGEDYLLMTHEMASVRTTLLGDEVASLLSQRQLIKNAIDFLLDGF
ncbi:toxin CcdB [Pasteurella testudinis DSM 23072]|uniref:Toxin CcdB n=1 Tax=Pasteurella testudinis DSM 23072 TaxID=1122938 RepID=A0A1W1VBK2_9PAST|nr:CcdB family protein [Pasteurella testudinis]SMB90570.1 toxin CcdB [Pasteurella testudinis DSM 23072]SUB52826.1 plasmid maintenance protein CcdB [Pasteurella testudinis]